MAKTTAAGYGVVKVDSAELKAKAEDAYQKIRQYQETVEQMSSLVSASSSYWGGEAGEMYREVLRLQINTAKELLETYKNYPKELLEYAGIYSEVIAQTESLAESINIEMF